MVQLCFKTLNLVSRIIIRTANYALISQMLWALLTYGF